MITLIDYLRRGCGHYGLELEEKYVAKLAGRILLPTVARILDLGAPNGILIFSNSQTVWQHRKLVSECGFAFSVLSDPLVDEEFDSASFKEMILDWGWASLEKPRPIWMQNL